MDRSQPEAGRLREQVIGPVVPPAASGRILAPGIRGDAGFEHEVDTLEPLLFLLRRFLNHSQRLRCMGRVAGSMTLTLTLERGEPYERFSASCRRPQIGSFENRTRLCREIVAAVRSAWPKELPLFVRISATDWIDGGWNIDESVKLAAQLKPMGVDLIDCSSGGNVPHAKIPVGPGYQVAFAERIRREAEIMTGAVGMITSPVQAEHIIRTGQADAVIMAREFLRDPYWPLRAARELEQPIAWPVQYLRAAPKGAQPRVPVDLKSFESCFEEQHGVPER